MANSKENMTQLKGVCTGAGYFSQFHYDGWNRIDEVEIAALCDTDQAIHKHCV